MPARPCCALFYLPVLLALAACQPVDPLDQVVVATSPAGFERWKTSRGGTPELRREFDAALQDIRFAIMRRHEASGSERIDEAMRAKVDGKRVRAAINLGYEERLSRLREEQASLVESVVQLARVRTREGDSASAAYVAGKRQQHADRLRACEEEILVLERRLGVPHHVIAKPREPGGQDELPSVVNDAIE